MPRPLYTPRPIIGQGFNTMDWITPERLKERQKRLREEKRIPPFGRLRDMARHRSRMNALSNDMRVTPKRLILQHVCSRFHTITCRMFRAYLFDNGRPRRLSDFGADRLFERHRSVRTAISRALVAMLRDGQITARQACSSRRPHGQNPSVARINLRSRQSVNVNDGRSSPLFALGGGNIDCRAQIALRIDCARRTMDADFQLIINYEDRFEDALDINNSFDFPRRIDIPGSRPYIFSHRWMEPQRWRGINI